MERPAVTRLRGSSEFALTPRGFTPIAWNAMPASMKVTSSGHPTTKRESHFGARWTESALSTAARDRAAERDVAHEEASHTDHHLSELGGQVATTTVAPTSTGFSQRRVLAANQQNQRPSRCFGRTCGRLYGALGRSRRLNTGATGSHPGPRPGRPRCQEPPVSRKAPMKPSQLRGLRHGATALLTLVGGLAASVNPAAADTTRYVEHTGSSLKERSGPGSSYAITGSYRDGAALSINCWSYGSTYTEWHGTQYNVWDKLSNGRWVADGWVSGDTRATIPQCGAQPGPSVRASDQVVARARAYVGQRYQPGTSTPWDGWCLRFVGVVHARSTGGYNTALDAFNAWRSAGIIRSGTPAPGAVVFWNTPHPYEHVGISLGGGRAISTSASGVIEHSVTAWPIMGWAEPPASWSGLY